MYVQYVQYVYQHLADFNLFLKGIYSSITKHYYKHMNFIGFSFANIYEICNLSLKGIVLRKHSDCYAYKLLILAKTMNFELVLKYTEPPSKCYNFLRMSHLRWNPVQFLLTWWILLRLGCHLVCDTVSVPPTRFNLSRSTNVKNQVNGFKSRRGQLVFSAFWQRIA